MFVQIQQVCGRSMLPMWQEEMKIKCWTCKPIFPLVKRGYFTNLITLCRDMGGKDLRRKGKDRPRKTGGQMQASEQRKFNDLVNNQAWEVANRGEQDQKSDIPKERFPTAVSTGMEKVRASNSRRNVYRPESRTKDLKQLASTLSTAFSHSLWLVSTPT